MLPTPSLMYRKLKCQFHSKASLLNGMIILSSLTTVLGVIPLLFDAFFKAMAVVLAFGLAFGTVLTLFVVPVLYAIFFKIGPDETAAEPQGAS